MSEWERYGGVQNSQQQDVSISISQPGSGQHQHQNQQHWMAAGLHTKDWLFQKTGNQLCERRVPKSFRSDGERQLEGDIGVQNVEMDAHTHINTYIQVPGYWHDQHLRPSDDPGSYLHDDVRSVKRGQCWWHNSILDQNSK